jgi:hypothetical protein
MYHVCDLWLLVIGLSLFVYSWIKLYNIHSIYLDLFSY